jgi:hypothetical protein
MADVLIKEWDVGAMRRPAANAPSASRTPGANFPWDALNFDDTDAEYIYAFGTMPEADIYAAGQNIEVEIPWVTDGATVGTVRWKAEIVGRTDGEAWDVAFADSAEVGDPRTAANALHVALISIAAPSLSPGDDFILKLSRNPGHGEDNYGADADMIRARLLAV